ncbi:hypothetical protein N7509_013866 [Penicillium cosmopolitanum]|uniref:Zn(2)-C6 fungal-type domain-containing protein n=1 Tax=Penicillium cosmopolitanum TaxID=1131564 RepID=A0A9W9SFC4_9EURO|nr:uncharacterized protein N7509_013866 [Penicillium cosmopolitanum]KAJ5376980.1 hypothetical protein N7509_013866 [Penicillium cosmopolitanum]
MRHTQSDSSGPMQGHRSVFRVPNYKPQPTASDEPSDGLAEPVYHSRRTHRKSRAGCAACKQRRVKCDETKPHCLRCQKHGVECNYSAPARSRPAKHIINRFLESRPDLLSVESLASSMSLLVVAEKLGELLRPDFLSSSPDSSSSPPPARALEALHHFHHVTVASGQANSELGVMMGKVAQLAFESPLLMHSLIGVATSHLCGVLPNNSSYRVAESYHWQQAIQKYTKEVSSGLTAKNMDPLYSACIMITIHSFAIEEFNPRSSFVFSDDPADLNWLRLQGGLRYLLERTSQWMPDSMWWAYFMHSHDDQNLNYEDDRPGRVDLDPDFADLCHINEDSTVENNAYLWPLRMLTNLLALERTKHNYQKYYNWMGRLEPEYYDCLLRKEPPALVLLAWWLALMTVAEEWWIETRIRSECTAICMKLEDSWDPVLLRLLEFPADSCGYLLRHVQERNVEEILENPLLA